MTPVIILGSVPCAILIYSVYPLIFLSAPHDRHYYSTDEEGLSALPKVLQPLRAHITKLLPQLPGAASIGVGKAAAFLWDCPTCGGGNKGL